MNNDYKFILNQMLQLAAVNNQESLLNELITNYQTQYNLIITRLHKAVFDIKDILNS